MDSVQFEQLVKQLVKTQDIPEALALLKASQIEEIVTAAEGLTGQFAIAEVQGQQRIYHQFQEMNDANESQEFVDHIMNLGDDMIVFVAWFFYTQFDIKDSETYAAAGKTYKQPKKVLN